MVLTKTALKIAAREKHRTRAVSTTDGRFFPHMKISACYPDFCARFAKAGFSFISVYAAIPRA
jgi:hypothetical protein